MIWPLGPYTTALAAVLVAVAIWRRADWNVAGVILANYFWTAAALKAGFDPVLALVAVGVVDLTAVIILCSINGWRALTVAMLFACMISAYVASVLGAVELAAMWGIVELIALVQIAVLGTPNGMAERVDRRLSALLAAIAGRPRARHSGGRGGIHHSEVGEQTEAWAHQVREDGRP